MSNAITLAGMCEIFGITVHPAAELFPMLSDDDIETLGRDISQNGLRVPLVFTPDKQLLDGRNRLLAMARKGIDGGEIFVGKRVCQDDPYAYVVSVNIHRRHLTTTQRKELAAALLKANPAKSDRQAAAETKLSDKTVAHVREELETRAEIPNVPTRADSKGREQPAKKKSTAAPTAPAPKASQESVMPSAAETRQEGSAATAAAAASIYDDLCTAWDLTTVEEQQRFLERIGKTPTVDPVAQAMALVQLLSTAELEQFNGWFTNLSQAKPEPPNATPTTPEPIGVSSRPVAPPPAAEPEPVPLALTPENVPPPEPELASPVSEPAAEQVSLQQTAATALSIFREMPPRTKETARNWLTIGADTPVSAIQSPFNTILEPWCALVGEITDDEQLKRLENAMAAEMSLATPW
jgi:hypothetical protein